MRLVGATDRFIKIPFYLEGMIQGGVGSLIGLTVLLAGYYSLAAHFQQTGGISLVSLRFFSPLVCLGIVLGGVLVGWLGCLISLKQFMKD
jgi:cell division transport system permease protein